MSPSATATSLASCESCPRHGTARSARWCSTATMTLVVTFGRGRSRRAWRGICVICSASLRRVLMRTEKVLVVRLGWLRGGVGTHELTCKLSLPFHVEDREASLQSSVATASLLFSLECQFFFYVYHVDLDLCTSSSWIVLRQILLIHISSSHAKNVSLLLAIAQTDDSPPTAPSPLPGATVASTAFHSPEFLIFAPGQTNDNVSLDSAE